MRFERTHACEHTYTRCQWRTPTLTHTHAHTRTHAHTHTHAQTHTHARACAPLPSLLIIVVQCIICLLLEKFSLKMSCPVYLKWALFLTFWISTAPDTAVSPETHAHTQLSLSLSLTHTHTHTTDTHTHKHQKKESLVSEFSPTLLQNFGMPYHKQSTDSLFHLFSECMTLHHVSVRFIWIIITFPLTPFPPHTLRLKRTEHSSWRNHAL